MATIVPPIPGRPVLKASVVRTAPFAPLSQAPVIIITKAVSVQIMSVSIKVPNMAIKPC